MTAAAVRRPGAAQPASLNRNRKMVSVVPNSKTVNARLFARATGCPTTAVGTTTIKATSPIVRKGARSPYPGRRSRMVVGLKSSANCAQRKAARITLGSEARSEEHTSELQSLRHLVCRLLLEKKKSAQ